MFIAVAPVEMTSLNWCLQTFWVTIVVRWPTRLSRSRILWNFTGDQGRPMRNPTDK